MLEDLSSDLRHLHKKLGKAAHVPVTRAVPGRVTLFLNKKGFMTDLPFDEKSKPTLSWVL